MPSVLAEISFVTNPQEARLLKGNVYRQRIAEALFNAIRKYQTSLKSATTRRAAVGRSYELRMFRSDRDFVSS